MKKSINGRFCRIIGAILAGITCFSCIIGAAGCGKKEPDEKAAVDNTPVTLSADPSQYNVGDEIELGRFEQDNEPDTGREAVKWIIAEKDGTKLTLVSKYCLASMGYNETRAEVSWETCSLRKWLNGDFINATFSEPEKKLLLQVKNEGVFDSAYILDEETAASYFPEKDGRKTSLTEFAKGQNEAHFAWLRGKESGDSAPRITLEGDFREGGLVVNQVIAVRPVIRIDLSKIGG